MDFDDSEYSILQGEELDTLHQRIASLRQERDAAQREVAALRAERDYFRLIADFTHDWSYWRAPDGTYRYVSPSCECITGYRPDEFQTDPHLLERIIHPDDHEHVGHHLSDIQRHQQSYTLQFRIITRSGEERWMSHACQPMYNAAGEWLGQRASNHDITEQKQTEQALRESRRLLQGIIDYAPLTMYIKDTQGRYVQVSQNAARDIGFVREAFLGKTDHDLFPDNVHDAWRTTDQHILATGKSLEFEVAVPLDDGVHSFIATKFPIFNKQGAVCAIGGLATDITEHKKLEEALREREANLRAILENTDDFIASRDREGRLVFYNPAFAQIVKRLFQREARIGMKTTDYLPDAAARHWETVLARVLDGERHREEFTWDYGNGEVRVYEIAFNPIKKGNEIIGTVEFNRDITEQKRAEEERRQAQCFTRSILDSLPTQIAVLDEHGTILNVNSAWNTFAGANPPTPDHAAEGANYLTVCDHAFGEGSDEAAPFAAIIRAVIAGERDYAELEYPCAPPTGGPRWFTGHVTRLQGTDEVRVVVWHTDITERKRLEEEARTNQALLQGVLDHAPVFIFAKDLDGRITLANPRLEQLFQVDKGGMPGKTDYDFHLPDIAAHNWAVDQEVQRTRQPIEQEEYGRFDDGTLRTYLSIKFPLFDANGNLSGTCGIATDITERKRMEEALRESEARYRTLVNNFPNGVVFLFDQDMRYLVAGGSQLSVLGMTPEMLEGKTLGEAVPPDVAAIGEPLYRAILAGTAPAELEQYYGNHTYRTQPVSLRNGQGDIVAGMIISQDITARKQIEKALRESEERYRAMFEHNRAVKLLIDPATGTIIDANLAASEFYGYPLETLRRMKITDLNVLSAEEVHAEMRRAHTDQRLYFLFRHRLASGDMRDVEVYSGPIDIGGKQLLFSIIHDITARKQAEQALRESEERYRLLANNVTDMISRHTSDGTYLYVSPACQTLLGYSPDELVGRSAYDLFHPDDLLSIQTSHTIIMRKPVIYTVSYRIRRKDAQYIWFETTSQTIHDPNSGALLEIIAVSRDITERKQAEEQIQRTNEWLKQRNHEVILLNQMGEALQRCQGVADACQVIANNAAALFAEHSGAFYIRRDETTSFDAVARWGSPLPPEPTLEQADCHALRHQQVCLFSRAEHEVCFSLRDGSIEGALCVPLIVQDDLLGILHLRTNIPMEEDEHRHWQQLAETVARQGALALSNLNLRERLQQQAIRDGLTGLFNRRYLDETLPREVQRAEREGQSVGVIMLDIDHFKRFNDTYGHDAGDVLLRAVGVFLKNNTRNEDIICRYGGEEFTLVLPRASLDNTRARAEYLREGVKSLVVQYQGQVLDAVTASLGIAIFPDHGSTADRVVKAADEALYQAKRSGRDRVVVGEAGSILETA